MATRSPLVIVNGAIQQLQSGDQLAAGVAFADLRTLTNGETATALVIGAPAYMFAAGSVKRAQANAASTSKVIGLGYDVSTAFGASGQLINSGVMTATTAQWDAVTGGTGGLVFNTTYYLDATTVGKLTPTAPSATGQSVVQVGVALSTTDMEILLGSPILL